MGCIGRTFQELPPWLKLPCKSGLQWEDFSGLPPDWNCHVREDCNGLQWEDFLGYTPPLDWNCHVRVGWNGRTFQELLPWLKLPCKRGLQWAAMGGLFRNYPPWLKLPCKSGLQGAAMGGLFRNYPLDWNCHVTVGCNGLQWEDF